jgi:phosphate starvation-inducible PhoH-like protein
MSAPRKRKDVAGQSPVMIEFPDHALLPLLFGEHDQNLLRIEQQLNVGLACRGNHVQIAGDAAAVDAARAALKALYQRLEKGLEVTEAEVDAAVRMTRAGDQQGKADEASAIHAEDLAISTRKRLITPRSPGQAAYVRALSAQDLVFGIGPAGTGKTYLAVAKAVEMLVGGKIDRIILSRPAVEAGERLGFLPGDLLEKVDPYLRPLYDALYDMLPGEQVTARIASGEIEVAPLAFMRGRTLSNAYIILDEAQNTTPMQMKMFLTRMGENSRMVVTGDLTQIDLPSGQPSGLADAARILAGMPEVTAIRFTDRDVVRHSLVQRIVEAYGAEETKAAKDTDAKQQRAKDRGNEER